MGLHCLREYLDHPYRQLMDILQETPAILDEFGLTAAILPDFTTLCARKQAIEMEVWRELLRLSVSLNDSETSRRSTPLDSADERSAATTANASDTTFKR